MGLTIDVYQQEANLSLNLKNIKIKGGKEN